MKTGRRFILRGMYRLPYRVKIISRYVLDLVRESGNQFPNIEEIRDKHKGETIFIIGSGPSVDTYPVSFLNDKLSMTLHLSFLKFPNPTYAHIAEADRIEFFKKYDTQFFMTQGIYCDPLFPLVSPYSSLRGEYVKTPYLLKYNPRRLHFKKIQNQIEAALTGIDYRYQSNSTCLHTGIWSSLILGFKVINLIGCDHSCEFTCEGTEEKHYFSKAIIDDNRNRNKKFFLDAYNRMNTFTIEIIKILERYNIEVNRFDNYEHFIGKEKQ